MVDASMNSRRFIRRKQKKVVWYSKLIVPRHAIFQLQLSPMTGAAENAEANSTETSTNISTYTSVISALYFILPTIQYGKEKE